MKYILKYIIFELLILLEKIVIGESNPLDRHGLELEIGP